MRKVFAVQTPHRVITFFADGENLDRFASSDQLVSMFAGQTRDGRIKTAAKSALSRGHHQQMHFILTCAREQSWRAILPCHRRSKVA